MRSFSLIFVANKIQSSLHKITYNDWLVKWGKGLKAENETENSKKKMEDPAA